MRFIWLFLLAFLCCLGCTSAPAYWTYHLVPAPTVLAPKYIPVWLDSRFSPPQVEQVRAALQEWNGVLNGHIVLVLQQHSSPGVDLHSHQYPTVFQGWEAGQTLVAHAAHHSAGVVIFDLDSQDTHVSQDASQEMLAYVMGPGQHFIVVLQDHLDTCGLRCDLKGIIMHEIAHLLGATHVNAPSLINPTYNALHASCIDKITVLQVATEQHLDFHSLNYCITPDLE